MQENQVDLNDSSALLDIATILTGEINANADQDSPEFTSLVVTRSLIQSWSKDGLCLSDKPGQVQAG